MRNLSIPDNLFSKGQEEVRKEFQHLVGKDNYEDFKKFAFKGNLMQMTIAFMMGNAFNKVISALASDIIMPFINYFTVKTDGGWRAFQYKLAPNLVLAVGNFAGALIDFLIMALVLFILYKKFFPNPKPQIQCIYTVPCLYCYMGIDYQSTRCPFCTTELKPYGQ